jgi:hypothetical protein
MIRYRPIFALALVATLVHALAGCKSSPPVDDLDPVPAIAEASALTARVEGSIETMGQLTASAGEYAGDTADYIHGALQSLSTGVAEGITSAVTQLGQADSSNEKTRATIASLEQVVTTTRLQVTDLAAKLVEANRQKRELQHEHAAQRMKFADDLRRETDRADAAEATLGYRIEMGIRKIAFWAGLGVILAVVVGLLGSPIGVAIGGPFGGALEWLSTAVMHIGTLGISWLIKKIAGWRAVAKGIE